MSAFIWRLPLPALVDDQQCHCLLSFFAHKQQKTKVANHSKILVRCVQRAIQLHGFWNKATLCRIWIYFMWGQHKSILVFCWCIWVQPYRRPLPGWMFAFLIPLIPLDSPGDTSFPSIIIDQYIILPCLHYVPFHYAYPSLS